MGITINSINSLFILVALIGIVCIIIDMVTNKDGSIENDELKNL